MEQEELYSIDVNEAGTFIIYGGKSELVYISDFPTLKILHRLDDFSDSVIFTKFINDDYFVAASYDGIVNMYFIENNNAYNVNSFDVEEDITKIDFYGPNLIIGTSKGSIHMFQDDFSNEVYFSGQNTEIRDIRLVGDKLYTLSKNKFIIFSVESGLVIHERILIECLLFILDSSLKRILFSGTHECVMIKDDKVCNKYTFGAEAMICLEDTFIVGGDYLNLNFIDENNDVKVQDFSSHTETVDGISKIIDLGNSIIAFSTFCGKIFAGNYNKKDSYKMFDCGVGIIFDFKFYYRHILVCGSDGINIIDL